MTVGYYQTKSSVEEYIRLAKDVNGRELIKKLKKYLPSDADLLEIGSGPGTDWNILKANYKVVGSDNSPEFLRHLRRQNPEGNFLELDAITIETDRKFDGIYSNKVMQHLKDHELTNSIKKQGEVLNHQGIICHSFWRGEGSEYFKGLFVNYHSHDSLHDFFGSSFNILLIEEYAEFEKGDSILLIAKKK